MSVALTPAMTSKDLPQAQRNLFDKAVAAVRLLNNDYAIQLLMNILKETPEFLEGRQLCRKAAVQKKQSAGKKFLGMNTSGLSVLKLQQKAKKDPAGTMVDLEIILADDPYNVQANQMLFDCPGPVHERHGGVRTGNRETRPSRQCETHAPPGGFLYGNRATGQSRGRV
jgi:hypothetical protein